MHSLVLVANVQGSNAAGEIVIAHAVEASVEHHLLQFFLRWVAAYGFHQVLITVAIVGDQLSEHGNHIKGISVVDSPEGLPHRAPHREQAMVAQDEHVLVAQVGHQPLALGEIHGDARAEAGDTLWLDDTLMAIGRGFRTNGSGVAQLSDLLEAQGIRARSFDLPYYQGQDACLHLMSLISLVDTRSALVLLELLPVALRDLLLELDYQLIAAPFDEFQSTGTLSTNVLATEPGKCIMLDGIPKTRAALEAAGVEVTVFQGDALCIGCEGGPTCLTRPILRQH